MSNGILVVTECSDQRFRKSTYEVISEGRRLADQLILLDPEPRRDLVLPGQVDSAGNGGSQHQQERHKE